MRSLKAILRAIEAFISTDTSYVCLRTMALAVFITSVNTEHTNPMFKNDYLHVPIIMLFA